MLDFTIRPVGTEFHCIVYRQGQFRSPTEAEKGGFRTEAAAERWAVKTMDDLDRRAQEFADDPITQYYGL